MNFEIFDEGYYLKRHSFLVPAIEQGIVSSGLDHFQRFGQAAGLTEISRYFDEDFYLENNPGIQAAVDAGQFVSGLDHYLQFGYEEGRTLISSDYDESFYLASNPDIVPFVENGSFSNGLQHFAQFGAKEGRFSSSFFEPEYLGNYYFDVAVPVDAGTFRTGRDHYEQVGQFDPARFATFVGTREDDVVEAFGLGNNQIAGVEISLTNGGYDYYYYYYRPTVSESSGRDEFDVLIGSSGGQDTFILGTTVQNPSTFLYESVTYYKGEGEARIQNFSQADNDGIKVVIESFETYELSPSGADLVLSVAGDTLAVIEGGAGLTLTPTNVSGGPSELYQQFTLV
ncbi:MAG: calcium-binding protein [Oscillatoriales cyanobacterium RM2_1_1]|nr:calcium-binding protein [Oscillatoriales cyanobacterium SM2_3_0]NJO47412.1 calcium-binding protein [Oscillatoriales cyanobacterium RM2_1_1]